MSITIEYLEEVRKTCRKHERCGDCKFFKTYPVRGCEIPVHWTKTPCNWKDKDIIIMYLERGKE